MRSSPPEIGKGAAQAPGAQHLRVVAPSTLEEGGRTHRFARLSRGRVRTLVACDLVALALSYRGTYAAAELIGPPAVIGPAGVLVAVGVAWTLVWIATFAAYRLYE